MMLYMQSRAPSGTVWIGMAYQHFFGCLENWYALQAFAGNWSLMFASICGQNSAGLRKGMEGKQSYHSSTYFFPLQALIFLGVFFNCSVLFRESIILYLLECHYWLIVLVFRLVPLRLQCVWKLYISNENTR